MRITLTLMLVLYLNTGAYSQEDTKETTLFGFDHRLYPIGNDDVDISITELEGTLPTTLGKTYMENHLRFERYQFSFNNILGFDTQNIEGYYGLTYGLDVNRNLAQKWKLGVKGNISLASNASKGLFSDNVFFTGGLYTAYQFNARSKVELGLGYYAFLGAPTLLPTVEYYNTLNEKWSLKVGFPESKITYDLNDRHQLSILAKWNGFYANLSTPQYIDLNTVTKKMQFNESILSIEYNYRLDSNWSFYFKGGAQLSNQYSLLNDQNNELFNFQLTSKPFFASGITFNIKNN